MIKKTANATQKRYFLSHFGLLVEGEPWGPGNVVSLEAHGTAFRLETRGE